MASYQEEAPADGEPNVRVITKERTRYAYPGHARASIRKLNLDVLSPNRPAS